MSTPYSRAWQQWITSAPAIKLLALMGSASIYNENRLREAFDAGWKAGQDAKAPPLQPLESDQT